MRRLQTMWAALRAIGRAGAARHGSGTHARSAGAGVYSGWIGPDGPVEEAPGTAVHVALLARFGEPTEDRFFAKGAVRYVDASDHVSLELVGNHPVALRNAIEVLTRRWAHMADVDVEFLAPPEVLRASSVEVREALGRRLQTLQGTGSRFPVPQLTPDRCHERRRHLSPEGRAPS